MISLRAANSGVDAATASGFTPTLPAGWQPGDFLAITVRCGATGLTFSQTGGTGTWDIREQASVTANGYSYMHAAVVMPRGGTAPTFSWGSSQHWAYAVIALACTSGSSLYADAWAADADVTTAGTTSTPGAASCDAGSAASVILICGRASGTKTITAWTYTPPAGWVLPSSGSAESSSVTPARLAGCSYRLNVTGTVTPGSQTWTDNGTGGGNTFLFSTTQILVGESQPLTALPWQPRTWPRGTRAPGPLPLAAAAQSSVPLAEAGSADDSALAVTAAGGLAETGIASDVPLAVTAAAPLADSGSAADALGVGNAITLADSGSAADALAAAAAPLLAESGGAAETLAAAVSAPLADSGSAADAAAVTAAVPLAESGAGADAVLAQSATGVTPGDSGSGADALSLAAAAAAADSGTGTDTASVTAAVALAETGSGGDSLAFVTGLPPAVNAASSPAVTAPDTSAPAAAGQPSAAAVTPRTVSAAAAAGAAQSSAVTAAATSASSASDG